MTATENPSTKIGAVQDGMATASSTTAQDIVVAQPTNAPTLMNIAAENRIRIYKFLLIQENPISLDVINRKDGKEEFVPRSHNRRKRNESHPDEVYDHKTNTRVPIPPSFCAILLASKQVYREAREVLYGGNVFLFSSTTSLRTTLPMLGDNATLLRYVTIDRNGFIRASASKAMKDLAIAKNLRRIEFSHNEICKADHQPWNQTSRPLFTIDEIVKTCQPLLESLQKSYRGQNLKHNVTNLIKFNTSAEACRWCLRAQVSAADLRPEHKRTFGYSENCLCKCSEIEAKNEEIEKRVSGIVAEKMGLAKKEDD